MILRSSIGDNVKLFVSFFWKEKQCCFLETSQVNQAWIFMEQKKWNYTHSWVEKCNRMQHVNKNPVSNSHLNFYHLVVKLSVMKKKKGSIKMFLWWNGNIKLAVILLKYSVMLYYSVEERQKGSDLHEVISVDPTTQFFHQLRV